MYNEHDLGEHHDTRHLVDRAYAAAFTSIVFCTNPIVESSPYMEGAATFARQKYKVVEFANYERISGNLTFILVAQNQKLEH